MSPPAVPLTFYMGVDPGKSGAVAVVDQAGANATLRAVPVIRASGKKGRAEYDLEGIRDLLEELRDLGPLFATVEKAHPMPFTFKRKKKSAAAPAADAPKEVQAGEQPMPLTDEELDNLDSLARAGEILSLPPIVARRIVAEVRWMREVLLATPPAQMAPGDESREDTGIGGTIVNYQRGFSMGWVWMLTALRIPYQLVVPQTWQSVMLAGTSGADTKQKSILACHRLFPGVSLRRTERSKVLDHNISDALLLAEFGRRLRLPGSLRIGEAQVPVGGQTRLL